MNNQERESNQLESDQLTQNLLQDRYLANHFQHFEIEYNHNPQQNRHEYFKLIYRYLNQIFYPISIGVSDRVNLLKARGGLSFILDMLKVNYLCGLNQQQINNSKRAIFGINKQNKSSFKYVVLNLWKQFENIIMLMLSFFYLVTLLIQITFNNLQIYDTIGTIAGLIFFAIVRCLINRKKWSQINPYTKYDSEKMVNVKRDFYTTSIRESELLVGDILILKKKDVVTVDGILLKATPNFLVNQSHSITLKQKAYKTFGWSTNLTKDPFIFSGTDICNGSGQMLVCTVGENCTFRKIKDNKFFLEQRIKFCSNLCTYIHSLEILVKGIMWTITFFQLFYMIGNNIKSMQWSEIISVSKKSSFYFSLLLMIDELLIFDYLCNFVQNHRILQQFTMIKKQIIVEIMEIHILFIDQPMLETKQQYNRNILNQYQLLRMIIINELQQIVHVKILSNKPFDQFKDLEIDRVYNVDKALVYNMEKPFDQKNNQIIDFREALYILDENISDLVEPIFQTFKILKYTNIAVIPKNPEPIYFRQLIITTDKSDIEMINASSLHIKANFCEQGLRKMYLISSVFYILYYTYFTLFLNNIILIGYIYYWSKQKENISSIFVIILSIFQYQAIYTLNQQISNFQIKKIELLFRMKKNLILFNVLTSLLYIVGFQIINNQQNLFVYLICNSMMRKTSLLRYGQFIGDQDLEFKFSRCCNQYKFILFINVLNIAIQWIQKNIFYQQLYILLSLILLKIAHLLLRELDKAMLRKK